MMIAQPRRIAAYNVYKRLKCSIGNLLSSKKLNLLHEYNLFFERC